MNTQRESLIDALYKPQPGRAIECLGAEYRPPEHFRHMEWELVAELKKRPADGDGQDVNVFECRMPARFFKLEALPSLNSVGAQAKPFVVTTGSGDAMARLIGELALAIRQGMVGFEALDKEEDSGPTVRATETTTSITPWARDFEAGQARK